MRLLSSETIKKMKTNNKEESSILIINSPSRESNMMLCLLKIEKNLWNLTVKQLNRRTPRSEDVIWKIIKDSRRNIFKKKFKLYMELFKKKVFPFDL